MSLAREDDLPVRVASEIDATLLLSAKQTARQRRVEGSGRSSQPTVSVVVPTLNEADNLPYVLPQLAAYADEIVLIDGHSTDDTVDVALRLCPEVRIILADVGGKGAALQRGFAECSGDIIVMIDADGSNDPAEIPRFVGALVSGADFAKGSRFLQGGGTADMPAYRRAGNRLFVWLVRMFFGSRYSDLCYGYNAFWHDVVGQLTLDANGFEIETMMNIRALRAGLFVVEVPSFEEARIHGESKLSTLKDGWRVLRTIFAELRPFVPLHPTPRASLEPESEASERASA